MKPSTTSTFPTRISRLAIATATITVTAIALAKPVPDNLGNGLNKIVENKLLQTGQINVPAQDLTSAGQNSGSKTNTASHAEYVAAYKAAVAREATKAEAMAIKKPGTAQYLVDIMPDGKTSLASVQSSLQARFPESTSARLIQNIPGTV